MSNKFQICTLILAIIGICLGAFSLIQVNNVKNLPEPVNNNIKTQYVMYIGTNDKDTYKPKFTNEEAFEIVDKICLKYFEGYTIQEATGSWIDEKNNPTHEYTIVCIFDDADRDMVYKTADEILEVLNQNTVLIETSEITIDYYSGIQ